MNYLGDFPQDQTIYHLWSTNDSAGGSVTRTGLNNLHVYKNVTTTTETQTGITNVKDFDSLTGVMAITIVTTNVFYAPACDYTVVMKSETIDGQTVSTPIFSFSIENRTGSPQAGALEITYTLRIDNEDSGSVLEGADVWITTDAAGSLVVWRGVTDANGVLRETNGSSKPWLDAGTYYFWRQKSGYTFSNPDTETFS